jgi:hypothetical protein
LEHHTAGLDARRLASKAVSRDLSGEILVFPFIRSVAAPRCGYCGQARLSFGFEDTLPEGVLPPLWRDSTPTSSGTEVSPSARRLGRDQLPASLGAATHMALPPPATACAVRTIKRDRASRALEPTLRLVASSHPSPRGPRLQPSGACRMWSRAEEGGDFRPGPLLELGHGG